jgi:hypothetical protein
MVQERPSDRASPQMDVRAALATTTTVAAVAGASRALLAAPAVLAALPKGGALPVDLKEPCSDPCQTPFSNPF